MNFRKFYPRLFVCLFVGGYILATEDNLEKYCLMFHNVGSRDQTQVLRLSGKHLYLLSYLARHIFNSLSWMCIQTSHILSACNLQMAGVSIVPL